MEGVFLLHLFCEVLVLTHFLGQKLVETLFFDVVVSRVTGYCWSKENYSPLEVCSFSHYLRRGLIPFEMVSTVPMEDPPFE